MANSSPEIAIRNIADELTRKGMLHNFQVHLLRATGPANMNNDFNQRQKRVDVGGVTRAGLSPQGQRMPIRAELEDHGELRTRYFPQNILDGVADYYDNYMGKPASFKLYVHDVVVDFFGADKTREDENTGGLISSQVLSTSDMAVSDYVDAVVAAVEKYPPKANYTTPPKKKSNKKSDDKDDPLKEPVKVMTDAVKKSVVTRTLGSSEAVFGQMATVTGLADVYSSVGTAYAYSVDDYAGDYDDYTAVEEYTMQGFKLAGMDDDSKSSGSGHMNTRDICANTYYQYAFFYEPICFENLCKGRDYNDPKVVKKLVEKVHALRNSFIDLFMNTVPGGHKNSITNRSNPVVVYIVKTHDGNVTTFDEAWQKTITPDDDKSVAEKAVEKLLQTVRKHNEGAFAPLTEPDDQYWMGDDDLELPDYLKRISWREFVKENP